MNFGNNLLSSIYLKRGWIPIAKLSAFAGKSPKILVTDSLVRVPKLATIGTIVQDNVEGPMTRERLLANVVDVDGLFCRFYDRIDKEVLDAGKNLKVIATMSAGYEHIDIAECQKRGIKIGYVPELSTESTAELALALLLATSRRIIEAAEAAKQGEWKNWASYFACGRGIADSTVGIYGMGRIGRSIAEKVLAFKPHRIIYNDIVPRANDPSYAFVSFDELLKESDFLVVAANATKENYQVFDIEAFCRMKTESIFINVGRGSLVDREDLFQTLKSRQILAAGLDVLDPEPLSNEHPLYQLKNCVILPHIGAGVLATRYKMAAAAEENIYNFFSNKPMVYELEQNDKQ